MKTTKEVLIKWLMEQDKELWEERYSYVTRKYPPLHIRKALKDGACKSYLMFIKILESLKNKNVY